jgi:hypothetical protein
MLRHRTFSRGFVLEEIILSNGTLVKEGTVLVPFHPEEWPTMSSFISVRGRNAFTDYFAHEKIPPYAAGFVTFENMWNENAF